MLNVVLLAATLLCGLVAGFLFAFAVVVMPGTARLSDREFLRAFREMDGVIQRGHPLFGLVWLGSALTLVAALVVGIPATEGWARLALVVAGAASLLGVQVPTVVVNVPLNNEVQAFDPDAADAAAVRAARARFEPRWNRWNRIRTVLSAVATFALLLVLLSR